jgi:hypothetical protein
MSKDVKNIRLDNGKKKHHEQKTTIPSNKNATRRRWSITLKSCEPPHSINKNGTGNCLFLRTFMSNRRMFIEQEEKCKKKEQKNLTTITFTSKNWRE